MATQLFIKNDRSTTHLGSNLARASGAASGWDPGSLGLTRGAGFVSSAMRNVVLGPVAGLEYGPSDPILVEFISEPLAADVTIAGTITFNIWGLEVNMADNVGPQVIIERISTDGLTVSTIVNSERGVEYGTVSSANNWTATPTSTLVSRGERIRVRVLGNDAGGTMAATAGSSFRWAAASAGVDGDSYVTFTENLTFESAPSGSIYYLTDTAETINPGAAVEKVASTSRGSGVVSKVTNTTAGWTAPIQWTDGGGGSAIEWYTPALNAITLGGLAMAHLRLRCDTNAANVSARVELAITNEDGSSPVVFASWCMSPLDATEAGGDGELAGAGEGAELFYLSADDVALTARQRIRIRVYLDDASHAPMVTAHTGTLFYNGTAGGASGDSWIQFPQTLVEAGPAVATRPRFVSVGQAVSRAGLR